MHRSIGTPLLALGLAALLAPAAAMADFEESFQFDAQTLTVGSLIGEITVVGHAGSQFEVDVHVQGDDAEPDLIRFDQESGSNSELFIVFPVEDHRRYVYPDLGRGRTSITLNKRNGHRGSWLDAMLGGASRGKIEVRGSGRGLEMWADVTIRVPKGKELVVYSGVGTMEAEDVDAMLTLDVSSGAIDVRNIKGDTLLDTGSGHVRTAQIEGDLSVDTGSGHVEVLGCNATRISIDTGSGHVELEDCRAETIEVDTGSGHVRLADVDCEELAVDTGSGGVEASALGVGALSIDTGSGSVGLELTRMGDGPYEVDTGSGSITLEVPAGASADVSAATSGGRVRLDVDDPVMHRDRRGEVEFEIGGGAARVTLETSSGGIRIRQR